MWCLSKKSVMIVVVTVVVVLVCFTGGVRGTYQLTILHTNDVHARIDQTNSRSGQCSQKDAQAGQCYGGFPRIKSKVQEIRDNHSNVVLVDAGDQFQGTIWFYAYGSNITAHFMNAVQYDIMALGNHEFDQGPSEAQRLVDAVTFPVLSCNMDASAYPSLQRGVNGSHVLMIGGQKVGFVGYTTTDTMSISKPEKVVFQDEVEAIRREVAKLAGQGVNKIVAVGHSGYTTDLKIAAEVTGVDVVVGGHSNTFLYSGSAPDLEHPVDEYPTVVTQADGSKVLVVQDYAFGKYLGFLQVTFDDNGAVTHWSGNPILLNSSVPQDPALVADLEGSWRDGVAALANETVGTTAVLLEGDSQVCRVQECNLGNMVADAMVMQNIRHSDSAYWNHVAVAIINSGTIRTTLEEGDITVADVLTVHPFRSTIDIVEIKGSTLRLVMEHSASKWTPQSPNGGFLQVSGLRVVYDMTKPEGSRVVDLTIRCADCPIPEFRPLDNEKVYKVITNSFLISGGDGYSVLRDNLVNHHLNGDLDSDVLLEYIKKYSPIIHGLEGRIRIT